MPFGGARMRAGVTLSGAKRTCPRVCPLRFVQGDKLYSPCSAASAANVSFEICSACAKSAARDSDVSG